MIDKEAFRRRVLLLAAAGNRNVGATLAEEFGISRQAASARLKQLVKVGELIANGTTKARTYELATLIEQAQSFPREGLAEDQLWRTLCAPVVKDLPENARDIWHYGITEMINNAVDHSGSTAVHVWIRRNALYTTASIADDGEGIFLKIQKALGLFDARESILELAKGKLTTDPANHTGEGIFFASKMFDAFEIRSGNLYFMHDEGDPDMLLEHPKDAPGTFVHMQLANVTERTTKEVFDKFAAPDEFTFDRTVVPVRLAQYEGEKLVSRSQAKRLTMRFDRFRTVVLDFSGVEMIGQAFADEVFRVFQAAHPQIELVPFRMTPAVEGMVKRALAVARTDQRP
jgi:biotin operon repressor/anti-sigma regulatory factor (Ser/Thr protein kinase)